MPLKRQRRVFETPDPASAIQIQKTLADIIMAFDECSANNRMRGQARIAPIAGTTRPRGANATTSTVGIVQGGILTTSAKQRLRSRYGFRVTQVAAYGGETKAERATPRRRPPAGPQQTTI